MSSGGTNPITLTIEILLALGLLAYFFFRKRFPPPRSKEGICKAEVRLLGGTLTPAEVRVPAHQPGQLLIHRLDDMPLEELFEIDSLKIYELLPARHTTIITINPPTRGRFPIVLGGEREAGMLVVE